MPKRLEDVEKEELSILDRLKGLPPKEVVKRAIVTFWFGVLGKEMPEWISTSDSKEEKQDKP